MTEALTQSASNLAQSEQDFAAIKAALLAKPALLQSILKEVQQKSDAVFAQSLKNNQTTPISSAPELALAEKIYQKQLAKQYAAIFALYEHLPTAQKIDLLEIATEVEQTNHQLRKQAQQDILHDKQQAVSLYQQNQIKTLAEAQQSAAEIKPITVTPSHLPAHENAAPVAEPPKPQQPEEKGLINQVGLGSPAAVTVNFPFTVIPGLPALSKVLDKIDRKTHFDLGFTIKGVADKARNPDGSYDALYRLNYAGFGIMSSKFNVQMAPLTLKMQESEDKDRWGGNSSFLTKHKSDNVGEKFSLNFNDSDGSVSYGTEFSYQRPSTKLISTFTLGHHFSNDSAPAVRVSAKTLSILKRVYDALPNAEERSIIYDRMSLSTPMYPVVEIADAALTKVGHAITALPSALKQQVLSTPAMLASLHLLQQHISASGLSEVAQKAVFAQACEQCVKNAQAGDLPMPSIKAFSTAHETNHTVQ